MDLYMDFQKKSDFHKWKSFVIDMKNNKLLVVFHVDQNNKQLIIKQQVACYKTTSSLLQNNK